MTRILLGLVIPVAMLAAQSAAYTQAKQPPAMATDIPAEEIKAVLDARSALSDRLIQAVDMGTYNVGVGVLRRTATKPGAPVSAINHEHITEVYYIISGEGTLVTGGTVRNARAVAADSEIVTVVVGPSNTGTFDQPAQRRRVKAGDVVIIPPGVYHGFDEVTTGIDYLAVRPDPDQVLPTDYLHPAVQALRSQRK